VSPIDVLLVVNALNTGAVSAEGESSVDVALVSQQEAAGDSLALLRSDFVIDQRIAVYDQQDAQAQVHQATREATRVSANNEVFGSSMALAIASGSYVDADRVQGDDADELDSLTLEQPWASGVDDIFGEWV
jgi:hypothetical protein